MSDEEFSPIHLNSAVYNEREQRKLFQGHGKIEYIGDNNVQLVGNPPKMTIVDEDGNDVDLARL